VPGVPLKRTVLEQRACVYVLLLSVACLEVRELSLERNHRITIVVNSNIIQEWDRSRDLVSTQESKDTKLGKTSVVKFGGEATFLLLCGPILAEAKGIIKVCESRMDEVSDYNS